LLKLKPRNLAHRVLINVTISVSIYRYGKHGVPPIVRRARRERSRFILARHQSILPLSEKCSRCFCVVDLTPRIPLLEAYSFCFPLSTGPALLVISNFNRCIIVDGKRRRGIINIISPAAPLRRLSFRACNSCSVAFAFPFLPLSLSPCALAFWPSIVTVISVCSRTSG